MTKYIVFWDAGMCGTDMNSGIVEYESEEDAIKDFYPEAYDWAEQMQELHGGYDEDEEIDVDSHVNIWAEEYDPEKHDDVL